MTELLFQNNSYIKEFEAEIIAIENDAIILDKTAFSYRGGGLQSDTGVLTTSKNQNYEECDKNQYKYHLFINWHKLE